MLKDIRKNKIFNRRIFFISTLQSFLSLIIFVRLSFLQIFKHKQYTIKSDNNRIKAIIMPAPRGAISARDSTLLATNIIEFTIAYHRLSRRNDDIIIDKLTKVLDLQEEEINLIKKRIQSSRGKIVSLINNASWDDVVKIEYNRYRLPGVYIENGIIRNYLYPFETAHFIGYTATPNENEIDKNNSDLYMHPNFKIGKSGIEKAYDNVLRGEYGVRYVEADSHENPVRILSTKKYQEGQRINLTIDIKLQQFAYSLMQGKAGSIITMNVKTGEILTYVSSPSFDSNLFTDGISKTDWQILNNDIMKPLNNRPISALYSPGSTFKLITAIASLEAGFDPNKITTCNGSFRLGRRVFHCWKKEGHGPLDMVNAIKHSCNIYFYNAANQIGIKKISDVAKRFGYGNKFNIGLRGIKSGIVPSPEWKSEIYKNVWVGGDTLNTSIGQGFLLASPLQMAVITSRMANGGVPIKPFLVRSSRAEKQYAQLSNNLICRSDYLRLIKEGMYKVINEPGGTAFGQKVAEQEFAISGKTGTTQVISKREDEMTAEEIRLKKNQNHAIFVGFGPSYNPKYAVSVVVEHGGSGSQSAAPIGRQVLVKAQELDQQKLT